MDMGKVESYPGTTSTAPGIAQVVYAPFETVIAIGALIRSCAIDDEEGKLDASLRLAQQPFSFLGAVGSLTISAMEIGLFFKSFKFPNYAPYISTLASGLGLALCTLELFCESIGLQRSISFLSKFYYSSPPKLPPLSEIQNTTEIKEKIIKWAQHLIKNPESMQVDLGMAHSQALLLQLNRLVTNLQAEGSFLSEPEVRAETQRFLQQVNDQILLSDLKHLQREYFIVSQSEMEKIDAIARKKFPELSEAELYRKKDGLTSQFLVRKGSNLARRVQCWFVRELNEKLEPLIEKLSHPDANIRALARVEAKELLELMDIQSKKKMMAHVIGIIGIVILIAGLIAGLVACPYLLPIVLLGVGGLFAIARYHFALGYWNSRGWHFEIYNCIPAPIRYIHKKIIDANAARAEAINLPRTRQFTLLYS